MPKKWEGKTVMWFWTRYCSLGVMKWREIAQSCLTLCNPMDCSLPGSIHEIFQARILEWLAISFSRGSSRPRDRTQVSLIAGRRFTVWATREARVNKKAVFKFTVPGGSEVKASAWNAGRPGFAPWVGKIPWRRKWQPTPVPLPGESHGGRSLVGYRLWDRKESDTTERLHFTSLLLCRKGLTERWTTDL